MLNKLLIFTLLTIATLMPIKPYYSSTYTVLNIEVYEDGWCEVTHIITNINSEFINVSIAKDAEFLLVLDFSEEPLDYELYNGEINIYSENLTGVKIIYYTQSFTSKNTEGVWTFNLLTDANEINIILPRYSTILGFEETPLKIRMEYEKISLSFNSKKISFHYIIEAPILKTTTQTKSSETLTTYLKTETQFITKTISNKTTIITSLITYTLTETIKESITKIETEFGLNIFYIILPLIVIAIILVIILLKKKRETMREYLTEEEEAIINILKKRDGVYQSELIEILNLPKTTVWRHLKRLEKMGKIKIIRKENKNYIVLK
ncbi:MAG: winged helix-turn-helix transcriptional regulator [Nitrososphaerota archaeon]